MVTRVPDSPSAYTIPPQASEGLQSPRSGISTPPDAHAVSSGAVFVPAEYPALRQVSNTFDSQHGYLPITFNCDAFITSLDHTTAESPDNPSSHPNNGVGQSWVNYTEASSGGFSQPVTQLRGSKRIFSPSPPPDILHKRPKYIHKSSAHRSQKRRASSEYDQPAERLQTSRQPSEAVNSDLQTPEPPSAIPVMTEEAQKSKRSFQCAFRKAQAKLKLPYTCTAAPVTTVSAVRTHLTRKLPKGRPPHLPFLRLCTTCNEDILDENIFKTLHGTDGLKCDNPQPQRKGDIGQQEQYDILCSKVEAYIARQGAQQEQASDGIDFDTPSLGFTRYQDVAEGEQLSLWTPEIEAQHLVSNTGALDDRSDALGETRSNDPMDQDQFSSESSLYPDQLDHTDDPWTPVHEGLNDRYTRLHRRTSLLTQTLSRFTRDIQPTAYPSFNWAGTSTDSVSAVSAVRWDLSELPGVHGEDPDWGDTSVGTTIGPSSAFKVPSPELHPTQHAAKHSSLSTYDQIGAQSHQYRSWTDSTGFNPQTPSSSTISENAAQSSSNSTLSDTLSCSLCPAKFAGVYRQGNYTRHQRHKHVGAAKVWSCTVTGCDKSFQRADARLKHYRRYHPELRHHECRVANNQANQAGITSLA